MDLNKWYEDKLQTFSTDEDKYKDKLVKDLANKAMPYVRELRELVKNTYWQSSDLLDESLSPVIHNINKIIDFINNNSDSNIKLGYIIQKH